MSGTDNGNHSPLLRGLLDFLERDSASIPEMLDRVERGATDDWHEIYKVTIKFDTAYGKDVMVMLHSYGPEGEPLISFTTGAYAVMTLHQALEAALEGEMRWKDDKYHPNYHARGTDGTDRGGTG